MSPVETIRALIDEGKYETARRTAMEHLRKPDGTSTPAARIRILLNEACVRLGDIREAKRTMEEMIPSDHAEEGLKRLLMAENSAAYSAESFYRDSDEAKEGYCIDEFVEKHRKLAEQHYADACAATADADGFRRIMASASRFKFDIRRIYPTFPELPKEETAAVPAEGTTRTCDLRGRLTDPSGNPASGIGLVLSRKNLLKIPDLRKITVNPSCGPQNLDFNSAPESFTATAGSDGVFEFKSVPEGEYDFLAAGTSWRDGMYPIVFLKQSFHVGADSGFLDLRLGHWESAPPKTGLQVFPPTKVSANCGLQKLFEKEIKNPFHYRFPRQLISFPIGDIKNCSLTVLTSRSGENPVPFQVSGGEIWLFAEMPPESSLNICVYRSDSTIIPRFESALKLELEEDGTAVVSTGPSSFRIPWNSGTTPVPPIMSLKGADKIWKGAGRFKIPKGLRLWAQNTELIEQGPLFLKLRISYDFGSGRRLEYNLTFHEGEEYVLVHEKSFMLDGASFQFSLAEFSGGRGYLHWCAEHDSRHWANLEFREQELARLQESVAWWIPKQGFAYAVTEDGLQSKDYVGVFTVRRGEWEDLDFERICNGPGDENRELDWPFPEMVGSTLSMITAHTAKDGDVYFEFAFFNGERRWGLLASSFDRNDGPFKEIGLVQHKNSSPRLDDFKDWRLDMQDHEKRPSVLADMDELRNIPEKIRHPAMAEVWKKILAYPNVGPTRALKALVEGDAAEVWRLKQLMIYNAGIRSKLTLCGRDFGDTFSPVGGRQITPLAEQYDLIAPTGVFSEDEERLVRSFFMLMGHMFMENDFMNWKYNSRNANFEADRTDIVGTIGICFRGNPDADKFVAHSTELMRKSLEVYCTPGSGKWYENPACYYLHASTCRLNLAYHLFRHGIYDSSGIERLKDYLRWGILLLTPKCPDYDDMCRPVGSAGYDSLEKVRLIPPVGDHARLGQLVPEYYLLMSKLYERRDAEFANMLKWAYFEGGCNGRGRSQFSYLLCSLAPEDLTSLPKPVTLTSRRLEGFGSVFRGNFGKDDEFYLLFKMGPGGYRYHRTEGSIILFADGKPLIYDGGEAGETWRHTTLSFHSTHMPLAAGHIERFATFSNLDFAQGVNPEAIRPGEPVYLSDNCHHSLVEVARNRFAKTDPVNARSVVWVKNEYVVMHDNLLLRESGIPVFWHLQAVADSHTGTLEKGYVFKGRFGTDFQVLLPNLESSEDEITRQPVMEYESRPEEKTFSMLHLQVKLENPETIGALIRPLSKNRKPLKADKIVTDCRIIGMRFFGDGISDTLFLSRGDIAFSDGRISFKGRYGMVLERKGCVSLIIIDGEYIGCNGLSVESAGQHTCVHFRPEGISVEAPEPEKVKVTGRA